MPFARGARPHLYSHDGATTVQDVVFGEIGRHLDDDPGDSEVDSLSWGTSRSELFRCYLVIYLTRHLVQK